MVQLSHYRVVGTLCESSFGTVFRAEDLHLGRSVAIRLLSADLAPHPDVRSLFLAESRAIAALEHPNLCVLYDFDDRCDPPFLVTELIEGETLEQALARGPLDEGRVCSILIAVGEALAAAHDRGILHRGVNSENILLGDDGGVKLADFGVALLTREPGSASSVEQIGGPTARSPEEIAGGAPTEASDQYALSVVATRCLTGRLDSADPSANGRLDTVPDQRVEPDSRSRPEIASAWDAVLGRALARNPSDRYPDVRSFVGAVSEIAEGLRRDARNDYAAREALDLVRQGRDFYARYTHSDNLRALACFERAAALKPALAEAWSGIADCCGQMHDKCWDVNTVWLDRGLAAAECAIQLDPTVPEGYKSLALIQLYRGDRPAACASLQRAIETKPDYLPGHVNLAAALRGDGDLAGAERSLRRAMLIDPTQPFVPWALAHLLLFTRRYAECAELCSSFEDAGSPYYYVRARVWRACAFAYRGETAAAMRELDARSEDPSANFGLAAAESLVAAMSGKLRSARRLLAELEIEVMHHLPLSWVLVETAAWLRDERTVVRLLGGIERKTTIDFAIMRILPGLARLDREGPFARWMGERGSRLVWPLEAPPLSREEKAKFSSFSERSGLPEIHATPNPVETLLVELRENQPQAAPRPLTIRRDGR